MNTSEASRSAYGKDTDLATRFGVSRATIWRWVKENDFPAPVRLGPGCTRWKLADIERWEAKQEAGQ